ncbi:transporter substrate-binding domain-containing protein [Mesorhizobium sp. AaZ16]|uniref:transporter substrate-binding domain-containing protein n=1 Tax=Mesorhizobium sp. AaZ16 TaxID=3402289 RepID=UPI00374E9746
MNRLYIVACAAFVTLCGVGTAVTAGVLDDIKSRGVVRVAVGEDFQPFGGVGPDMKPMGYDVDVANHLGEKLGLGVELVPVINANRIPSLQTGKVDIIVSTLGKTAEREMVLDFTQPYGLMFNAVFAPSNIQINDAAELSGKTIGVTRGTIIDIELSKIVPSDATIKRFEDEDKTTSAFLSGQVDAIGTVDLAVKALIKKNPVRVPEVKFIINRSPLYIGLPKGEVPLREAIDAVLTEMKADGSLNAISEKWLGEPLPDDL